MAIKWKWDGKTVQLSNEEVSYADQQRGAEPLGPTNPAAGQVGPREQRDQLSVLERMQQASPAQKREWSYYMRHALRDLKKGEPAEDWLLGLINSGGVNVEEDGYTWWKGLSEKDAGLVDRALDNFMNRIGVWYPTESGQEGFNPDALRTYQEDQNRRKDLSP